MPLGDPCVGVRFFSPAPQPLAESRPLDRPQKALWVVIWRGSKGGQDTRFGYRVWVPLSWRVKMPCKTVLSLALEAAGAIQANSPRIPPPPSFFVVSLGRHSEIR